MAERVAKTFSEILKFNPYHDSLGRFATSGGATSFTYRPGASVAHDRAIEREKQRNAYGATTTTPQNKLHAKQPREATPKVKAINGIENRIRKQNFESAALVDNDGNELFFKDGQRSQVGFTRIECAMMRDKTLTHNHPRCSMFSDADLKCMAYNGLYEIRATNRDGVTYSMKQASGGYSTSKAIDFANAYEKEYPKSTRHAQNDLDSRGIADKIWKGEMTAAEANIEFGRSSAKYMAEWAKKEAPKYGLVFTVEQASVTTNKSMGAVVMKTGKDADYMVLDRETNALEDRAFKEWLERAKKKGASKNEPK